MITVSTSGSFYQIESPTYLMMLNMGGSGINQWMLKETLYPDTNILVESNYSTNMAVPGIPFNPGGRNYNATYGPINTWILGGADSIWDDNDISAVLPDGTYSNYIPSGNYEYLHLHISGLIVRSQTTTTAYPQVQGSGFTNLTFYDDFVIIDNDSFDICNEQDASKTFNPQFFKLYLREAFCQGITTFDNPQFASGVASGLSEWSSIGGLVLNYKEPYTHTFHQYLSYNNTKGLPSGQATFITSFFRYPPSGGKADFAIGYSSNDAGSNDSFMLSNGNLLNAAPYFYWGRYGASSLLAGGPSGNYNPLAYRTDFAMPDPVDGSTNAGDIYTGSKNSTTYGDYDNDGYNEMIGAYVIEAEDNIAEIGFNSKRGNAWANGEFLKPRIFLTGFSIPDPKVSQSDDNGGSWSILTKNVDYYLSEYGENYLFQLLSNISGSGDTSPHIKFEPQAYDSSSGEFCIYLNGSPVESMSIFIYGYDIANDEFSMFITGAELINDNFAIYVDNKQLYNSFPIIMHGMESVNDEVYVFIQGSEPCSDSIPIYEAGQVLSSGSLPIYMDVVNIQPENNDVNIFIKSNPNENMGLYIIGCDEYGVVPFDKSFDIYIKSVIYGSLPIFVYHNGSTKNEAFPLYINGEIGPSQSMSIFVCAPYWRNISSNISTFICGGYGGIAQHNMINMFIGGSGLHSPDEDYPSEDGSIPSFGNLPLFLYNKGADKEFPMYICGHDNNNEAFSIYTWASYGIINESMDVYTISHSDESGVMRIYTIGWYPG